MHVAIYDAVVAIQPTHAPFAAMPFTSPARASLEAAVSAAAYGVLSALFPNRAAAYQPRYDASLAAVPEGDAKVRGLAVGAEIAAALVAMRANDGRSTPVAFAPGTQPGDFRGTDPVNLFLPYVRPFALTRASQFRAEGPPALESATYARGLAEVRALGGATSRERTAEQLEIARFHTEPPPLFWPRNLARLASGTLAENARLLAELWVAHADASIGCFESKYVYDFWRPQSAIRLADTDGHPDTASDPTWTPVVPTPNHPEYPAAHGCVGGATAEVLRRFFGSRRVTFRFDSRVTSTSRVYASTDELSRELQIARVYGGMHYRRSSEHGAELGKRTARWILEHHFRPTR